MPRHLALGLYTSIIFALLWADRDSKSLVSKGAVIPLLWMLVAGSRFVSRWLNIFGIHVSYSRSVVEGSPVDRAFFLILIVLGIVALSRRQIEWQALLKETAPVWMFFLFGAISIFWSDYPMVSTKRWIKAFGNFIMVLVILTDREPIETLGYIIKRMAFILLPLSILFIKYYPGLGRAYHMGQPMFHGVSTQKNGLGELCLICGIYFLWSAFFEKKTEKDVSRNRNLMIYGLTFGMIAWLLYKANSATAIACIIVASVLLIVAKHPFFERNPGKLIGLCVVAVVAFRLTDFFFGINDNIIQMLGRRPDLTTRVPMWQDLLSMARHPIIGFGFESFWLGPRREYMAEHWAITIQAHNGYLEMYLNLGTIGVLFLVSWILIGLKRVARRLAFDYPVGVLRLCFILVVALYNWTEATFYGVNNMWALFLFAILNAPNTVSLSEQDIERLPL